MKKVLVGYDSRTGHTEKMAEYIAEGVRMGGHEAEQEKISSIKNEKQLQGYDAYVFGCPTYHRDMTNGMKTFLFLVQKADVEGKLGGSFGSYTHSGDAPKLISDTLSFVFKMEMVDLGSLRLKEDLVATREGMRACQDYGKAVAQKLSHN
jgi:flavodoxin